MIELIGKQEKIVVKHYRDVDKLAPEILTRLKRTYVQKLDYSNILSSYRELLDYYFERLKLVSPPI
jgi:hypothetical protein